MLEHRHMEVNRKTVNGICGLWKKSKVKGNKNFTNTLFHRNTCAVVFVLLCPVLIN